MASKKSHLPNANQDITAPEVRLIDDKGEMIGVLSTREALDAARRAGLDLVEVSPVAKPPVCKLMDFGRFKFEERRKRQEGKKKQKKTQLKEVKLRPTIEENDYQVKLRSILKFLGNGDKVKVTLRFRGREIVHQEIGMKVMNRIVADSEEIGKLEVEPKLDGRQILLVLMPR